MPRLYGRVYQRVYKDRKGRKKLTKTYWADYSVGDRRVRESTGATAKKEAIAFLNDRLALGVKVFSKRKAEKTTFADLESLIRADYRKRRNRSTRRLDTALNHLRAAFGGWKAAHITSEVWNEYQDTRLRESASRASINRERSALVRMFRLAKGLEVPDLDRLSEDNVRDVDVSPAELARLLEHLPSHLRPIVIIGAITGWRRGELLSRKWADVDEESGFLWLDRETAKNKEPKAFPLAVVPWLDDTLREQMALRRRIEHETGCIVSALFFHHDGLRAGEPIKTFRRSWATACKNAGLPDLRFHDLRRTAAVQMLEAGIAEAHAMQFMGHKTRSIFDRYTISSRRVLRTEAAKLAGLYGTAPLPDRKVINLERRA